MRMGLHVHSGRDAGLLMDYVRRVQPPLVKFIDRRLDLMQEVKRLSPATRIVYRRVWDSHDRSGRSDFRSEMVAAAREIRGAADWIEGWNEFGPKDHRLKDYAADEVDFARRMLDAGIGAAIGGFSTGWIESAGPAFDALRPIFELCDAHDLDQRVIWHHHEYGGPYMQWMVQTPDGHHQWSGNGPTGHSAKRVWDENLEGYLCLRHRTLRRALDAAGYTGVWMAITESGIDDTPPSPGHGRGWRDYRGTNWASLPGIGDYADQQHWYAHHLGRSGRIVGYVDFGFADVSGDWTSFDLSLDPLMLDKMARRMQELPLRAADDPPFRPPANPDPAEEPLMASSYRPYVVKPGDTLWGIARDQLGAGGRWRELTRVVPMGAPTQLPVGTIVMVPEEDE